MIDQQGALPSSALPPSPAPVAPLKQAYIFSDDQYESFTYRKWFARQTGLSVEEAVNRGMAKRDYATGWKTIQSPDGLWHLSHGSTP